MALLGVVAQAASGATRFVSEDSAMCPIVAARDDVITAGDIEASCQARKKRKTGALELASTELRESVSVDTVTRERGRACITVAREPKKPARGTLAREKSHP